MPKREAMYYATVAAAALHQILLRTMTNFKALRDDTVVAQNVASGLFCCLFVALGVCNRPTLLATGMLGYLASDSASVTTAGFERVSPLSVIGLALLGCYCFGVLVWTGSLLVDQAGLIARNETSIERVKKTWRGRQNPHDRGAFRNWLDFLFRATPSVVLELDQVESRCEAA